MIMKEVLEKEAFEKRERSILLPFLVGGLVGAGMALLLAPKSGKEMRKDIKEFAIKTRDTVSTTIDTTIDKGKVLYEEGKTAVAGAIEAGKDAFLKERNRHRAA